MWLHERPVSTGSKFRFLYLGNDLKLIAAVRQALSEPEYVLVACSDREGAVLFLQSDIRYDALLIDYDWLGKEGLRFAQLTRSLRHRKRLPIVVVGTQFTSELQTVVLKAGVKTLLTKSPDMEAVTDAIRQLVHRHSRGR